MALIQFVKNYDDLSTDRGYQFRFYCDKCHNGVMTQFQTSTLGVAQSVLNVASGLFGGWGGAGNVAYEAQRAVGGKLHDAALAQAVEEARRRFQQCTKCGRWVCHEVCWNEKANLCEECAPRFEEHFAADQAQAKVQAAREQLLARAQQVNYAQGADLAPDSYAAAPTASTNTQAPKRFCSNCGAEAGPGKFCGECGNPLAAPGPKPCPKCGAPCETKFCGECGTKVP